MLLRKQSATPFQETLGLVMRRGAHIPPHPPLVHIGFVYRKESGEIVLSHLGWHRHFYGSQVVEDAYLWLESCLDSDLSEQVAAYLESVNERNPYDSIPYSIHYPTNPFDDLGKYLARADGQGLTCATYVLAVLERLSIPLINRGSWPQGREEDVAWAAMILDSLPQWQPPATPEHIAAQEHAVPNVVRFRPEEIATAFDAYPGLCEFSESAIYFDEIKEFAPKVRAEVLARS